MEVEARGKRRTVYLTDHLWRLARSWAIANDLTVSEVVEQTLLIALVGLRAEAVAEAQKAGRRLEPADARPAPKPVIAPADIPVSPHKAKMSIDVNHHRWSDAQRAVILGETVPDDPALTERVAAGVLSRLAADATLVKPARPAPKPVIASPTPKPATKPPGAPTNKAFSEFRPAPKPTSRKKR